MHFKTYKTIALFMFMYSIYGYLAVGERHMETALRHIEW